MCTYVISCFVMYCTTNCIWKHFETEKPFSSHVYQVTFYLHVIFVILLDEMKK